MAAARFLPWPALGAGLAVAAAAPSLRKRRLCCASVDSHEGAPRPDRLRVAFIGNSYLYFNDVPRLFQALCGGNCPVEIRDCLRGGASLKVLLERGNGMRNKFSTPNAMLPDGSHDIGAPTVQQLLTGDNGWSFVVVNTYSQEAALPASRRDGLAALDNLAPLLDKAAAVPVLMPTPAYRALVNNSERIGGWQDFTWKQSAGFLQYADRLADTCPSERQPRVAEVNRAFELVHGEDPALWRELFHEDDFHPSALGSFLEACVIYCTIFREPPVLSEHVLRDPGSLWARARRMLPDGERGRMPTAAELLYLRAVALRSTFCAEASGFEPRSC